MSPVLALARCMLRQKLREGPLESLVETFTIIREVGYVGAR